MKFDFLDTNAIYAAELFTDGMNADRIGSDYRHQTRQLRKGDELEFEMAPGGGFALKISKE